MAPGGSRRPQVAQEAPEGQINIESATSNPISAHFEQPTGHNCHPLRTLIPARIPIFILDTDLHPIVQSYPNPKES